ncbi:cryptochrome/photolyase family protein [Nostoc sphaeroides]|uniref:Deoxyribodipyrimidine photolyase-related protein n=1 Tax=Nostoc sphaeroides CCNUC1 TaxID=2653204 RepID=A0A5P8WG07_9NOSO|nr:deoxyribodipyrimidine photolyase-related protein [Nostoc sphaeroides CCNUC1]
MNYFPRLHCFGVWVLGDQLWSQQSALQSCLLPKQQTPVIFIESLTHAGQLPYHLQKLVLVWSAMRHFAAELRSLGFPVTYAQSQDFNTPLLQWIEQYQITELRVMTPTDRPFAAWLNICESQSPGWIYPLFPHPLDKSAITLTSHEWIDTPLAE